MANSGGQSAVVVLAKRFLLSKTADGFLSFISAVSVTGVALGALALTVVTSVVNGFEGELAKVITGMNGDIILYSRGEPISDQGAVEGKIRKAVPTVKAITASFVTEVMVGGASGVGGAVLEGFDPSTVGSVTDIPNHVISGKFPEASDEVALGSYLAEKIGAQVGSEVRIIAPFAGDSEGGLSGAPKTQNVKVSGIIKMGLYEYDSKFVFTPLDAVQAFLDYRGRVTSFKLKVAPKTDLKDAAAKLGDNFGYPFRAKDWGQLNKNLLYAIQLEKIVIAIILTVIVIVAAFNVVSTLMMMIHDKTKEISILKAMGFRKRQSFLLFCMIGSGIGGVGILGGVLSGLVVNWVLGRTRLIELPADIYYIGFLPVVVRWQEIAMIAASAMLITFAATIYPAYKVAVRSPLDGLRYE